VDVSDQLVELAGGDPFDNVRRQSVEHQREHGCYLYNAGAPVMQLVASIARGSGAHRALDLGCGIGYSTLWIASALGSGGTALGIDGDSTHIDEARTLAKAAGLAPQVDFETGQVSEVLSALYGPFDLIHDDAWFARTPDHLDRTIELLRPGGVLTMANWFLLVDALNGSPRNDWTQFAGPNWSVDTINYASELAAREDLRVQWISSPPVGFAVKL
jgi:predicted O-methyltransferase YrrM